MNTKKFWRYFLAILAGIFIIVVLYEIITLRNRNSSDLFQTRIEKTVVSLVLDFVLKTCKETTAHGIKHAVVVAKNAEEICLRDEAFNRVDPKVCVVMGLLHDVGREKKWIKETKEQNHGISGASRTRKFLEKENFDFIGEKEIDEISHSIEEHCYHGYQDTKLSKVLWDADKLSIFDPDMESNYHDYFLERDFKDDDIPRIMSDEKNKKRELFYSDVAKDLSFELENL